MRQWHKKLALLTAAALFCFVSLGGDLLLNKTGSVPVLNQEVRRLREQYKQENSHLIVIEGSILDRNGEQITRADEVGVPARIVSDSEVFSNPAVFSDLLGYNSDVYGRSGLRKEFEQSLFELNPAHKGRDLVLTIDAELQQYCYDKLGGEAGAIIVADAGTGELLAMASRSSGKLEYYADRVDEHISRETFRELTGQDSEKREPTMMDAYNACDSFFLNRALLWSDPPGSIMKVVTAAGMLEHGLEDFTYDDSEGAYSVEGSSRVIHNVGMLRGAAATAEGCDRLYSFLKSEHGTEEERAEAVKKLKNMADNGDSVARGMYWLYRFRHADLCSGSLDPDIAAGLEESGWPVGLYISGRFRWNYAASPEQRHRGAALIREAAELGLSEARRVIAKYALIYEAGEIRGLRNYMPRFAAELERKQNYYGYPLRRSVRAAEGRGAGGGPGGGGALLGGLPGLPRPLGRAVPGHSPQSGRPSERSPHHDALFRAEPPAARASAGS